MKKHVKKLRIGSFILLLTVFMSVLSPITLAASPMIGTDHPTDPGDVMLFTEVSEVYTEDWNFLANTWDIKLRIEALDRPVPTDIVLVMDRSYSMAQNRKLSISKDVANFLVDYLLDEYHPETRIALVSFAGDVTIDIGLSNHESKIALKDAIIKLKAGGGGLAQGGLHSARTILSSEDSTAANKMIILLSDGGTSYSYSIFSPWKDDTNNLIPFSNYGWQTPVTVPEDQFDYSQRVGTGNSLYEMYDDPFGFEDDKWYNNGNSAIAEAGFAKNEIPTTHPSGIYTIAIAADPIGADILNNISSGPGYAYNADHLEELIPMFSGIADQLSFAMSDAAATLPMGSGFQIPQSSIADIDTSPDGGTATYDLATKTISWDIGDVTEVVPDQPNPLLKYVELSYRVEINEDILTAEETPPGSGLYAPNGMTTLTYTDVDGDRQTSEFPVQTVNPALIVIEKQLVDYFGRPIGGDPYDFTLRVTDTTGNHPYDEIYVVNDGYENRRMLNVLKDTETYRVEEVWNTTNPLHTRNADDYETVITIDDIETNEFTIYGGLYPEFNIVVTNKEKALGSLTITKKLNTEEVPELPPDWETGDYPRFTINVLGPKTVNGDVLDHQVIDTVDLMVGQSVTLDGLPYGTYTIEEVETDGFSTTYDLTSGMAVSTGSNQVELTVDSKAGDFVVTNTPVPTTLKARKVWNGGDEATYTSDIGLVLKQDGSEYASEPVITEESPVYTYTYTDLPSVDEYARPYTYTVEETKFFEGFEPDGPTWDENTESWVITNTNTYVADPVSLTLNGHKVLTGRDTALTENEFSFSLYNADAQWTEGTVVDDAIGHTAAGEINLPQLTYQQGEAGDYYYILKENPTAVDGVVISDQVYRIKVSVSDNHEGQMVIQSVEVGGTPYAVTNHALDYSLDFENVYHALHSITYDPHGGTGTMENGRATDGEAFELPACEFTAPAGKQFKTWAIGSADGTQVDAGDTHTFMADTTVYAIWEDIPEIDSLQIAVFRAGNRTNYTVGETVALAARAENGTTPYRYQFYVIRSNGSKVILRDYAYSNVFNWQPVTPDTYQVGVNVKDAAGEVVNREETVTVDPPQVDPLAVAVFRTGSRLSYKPGDTITLAARAEGGTTPYRYQFYVIRSNGTEVILRDYAYSNVFDWQPVTPDTYQVGVRIRDGAGQVVDQEKAIAVLDPQAAPLAVAVFRAGYREYYEPGETIALAARAEGGAVPYRYRFHVVDSDGTKTILRDYAYSNVFRWTPEVPDIYQVFVSVKDGSGTLVEEQREIRVGFRK